MDREAMDALRYDRRLSSRRGFVSDEERAQAEAALPDVAAKAITLGDAADAKEPGSRAAPEAPAPPAPAPER